MVNKRADKQFDKNLNRPPKNFQFKIPEISLKWTLIVFIFVIILRILVGYFQNYFVSGASDGQYYFCYGLDAVNLHDPAASFANCPADDLLIKQQGFTWILRFAYYFHIPLGILFSIFFVIAAFLATYYFRKNFAKIKRTTQLIIFTLVAFFPAGFYSDYIYRDQIMVSIPLITFLLVLIFAKKILLKNPEKLSRKIWLQNTVFSLIAGMMIFLSANIKETGFYVYLFATVLLFSLIFVKIWHEKSWKSIAVLSPIALIPLVIFAGNFAYQNYIFRETGSRIVNTRTSGAPQEVANDVYRMKSNLHSVYVWAPYESIEKAFANSQTMRSRNGYENAVMNCAKSYVSEFDRNGIRADFLTWCFRWSFNTSNFLTLLNQTEYVNFMTKVDKELKAGFADGKLQKDSAFMLMSTGPRRKKDILTTLFVYKNDLMRDISLNLGTRSITLNENVNQSGISTEIFARANLASKQSIERAAPYRQYIVNWMNAIWMLISPILFIGGILTIPFIAFKEKKFNLEMFFAILFLGAFMTVQLGVTWMAIAFIKQAYGATTFTFYALEAMPYMLIFEILSLIIFVKNRGRINLK